MSDCTGFGCPGDGMKNAVRRLNLTLRRWDGDPGQGQGQDDPGQPVLLCLEIGSISVSSNVDFGQR